MRYIDGFVIPIPKKNVAAYRRIARKAGKIWCDHGALQYVESVGDDLKVKIGQPFTQIAKLKTGETVIFAWIVYKSRTHRDRVNAKVMKDPRMLAIMKSAQMPFEVNRMTFGGFQALVDL